MGVIAATLQLLVPSGPIELRALTDGAPMVERFANAAKAEAWYASVEAIGPRGVYVVMNPFEPALISGAAVNDAAVVCRRWLLVDVDPTRPKDSNSTKDELALAVSTARGIEEYLGGLGWPSPVRALSGNGAHLLYRVDLPNDAEAKALVEGVLKHLSVEFSRPEVQVDTTVSNAARITKLYGTKTRKGADTPERPRRTSKITTVPDPLRIVPREKLAEIAAKVAPPPTQPARETSYAPGESVYDLRDVLARVAVRTTYEKNGSTYHAIACPWQHEHSSNTGERETVIIVAPDGAMAFKCLHGHCANRDWKSVRDHLAIDTKRWKDRDRRATARPSPAPVVERQPGEDEDAPPAEPHTTGERVTIGDRATRPRVLAYMDIYAKTGAMPGAITSGMHRLDGMLLGGFRPGKFYVVGGETGGGKTTLFLQWALAAARRVSSVAIVSPEMDEDSLTERLLAHITGFGMYDYRHSQERVRAAWESATVPQNIRASFRAEDVPAFVEEERPGLLIVDYAQQAVSYDNERRHTALAMLGSECLSIAKRHRIPVLLGTQVNVGPDREFSVRETKILEHQADAMIFIDIEYDKSTDGNGRKAIKASSLFIKKHRHGFSGRIPIKWLQSLYRFEEA